MSLGLRYRAAPSLGRVPYLAGTCRYDLRSVGMRNIEQRIAAELRAELARQGRSRHWLAAQTGRPVTTVARWLRGSTSPGLADLDAVCEALGLTIPDLFIAVERNGGYVRALAAQKVATTAAAGGDTHRYSGPWSNCAVA